MAKVKVRWSDEDGEYVGTHDDYPSLSWLEPTVRGAIVGIVRLVADIEGRWARE